MLCVVAVMGVIGNAVRQTVRRSERSYSVLFCTIRSKNGDEKESEHKENVRNIYNKVRRREALRKRFNIALSI